MMFVFYLSQNKDVISMSSQGKYELTILLNLFKEEIKGITRVDKIGRIIYYDAF
jgi:hypothetical protein